MKPCSGPKPADRRDHTHRALRRLAYYRRSDHRRRAQAAANPLRRRRARILPAGQTVAWYGHNGVDLSGSGWSIDPASMSKVKDGFYGLGGVSFRGEAGAHTRLVLKDASHTRLEVS